MPGLTAAELRWASLGHATLIAKGTLPSFERLVDALTQRKSDYELEFLVVAYGCNPYFVNEPDPELKQLFADNTTLIPESWQDKLTAAEAMAYIRQANPLEQAHKKNTELPSFVVFTGDDKEIELDFLAAHPPRTKTDLSIRNCRISDVLATYDKTASLSLAKVRLHQLRGFDYITTCNILWASLLCPPDVDWWGLWSLAGAFDGDGNHFRQVTKYGSDYLKKRPTMLTPDERVLFYENHSLGGALLPPVEGFDPVQQTLTLAASGQNNHGLDPKHNNDLPTFSRLVNRLETPPVDEVNPRSLAEFISDYPTWERAGASSLGRVKWSMPSTGKHGKFKARKNLLIDVWQLDDIIEAVRKYGPKQANEALIKSELAKIRIAVASPLEVYLQQSWVMELAGRFYLRWPGNTMEEKPLDELRRNIKTWEALNGEMCWSLPFDYKNFDHQPTLEEVKMMESLYHRVARQACNTPELVTELDHVSRALLDGYSNATLATPPSEGDQKVVPVQGGVMSGLRATTLFNNAFNLVMGSWAQEVADACTAPHGRLPPIRECRGDDTKILDRSYLNVLGMRIGYEAIGAEGNDAKFGIYHRRTEFLRIETSDRARAYVMRTIPNLMQRKPWNPAPWRLEGRLAAVAENFGTCIRRGLDESKWRPVMETIALRWCRASRISTQLARIPMNAGGLGVLPWDGRWMPAGSTACPPLSKLIDLQIEDQTETRCLAWKVRADELMMPLGPGEGEELAREDLLAKIASDDIPDVLPAVREASRRGLRNIRLRESRVPKDFEKDLQSSAIDIYLILSQIAPNAEAFLHAETMVTQAAVYGRYGLWSADTREIQDRLRIASVKGLRLREAIGPKAAFLNDLVWVEKKLKLKRKLAIDWLLGTTTSGGVARCNPQLSKLVTLAACAGLAGSRSIVGNPDCATFALDFYGWWFTEAVTASPLSKRYYLV